MTIVGALLLCVVPLAAIAQRAEPLNVMSKLNFHAQSGGSPLSLAKTAAYAGILYGLDSPREWGQGGGAYAFDFHNRCCSADGELGINLPGDVNA